MEILIDGEVIEIMPIKSGEDLLLNKLKTLEIDLKQYSPRLEKVFYALKKSCCIVSIKSILYFLNLTEEEKDFLKKNIKNLKTIDQYFDMVNLLEEDRDRLLKDFSHGMKNKMQMLIQFIAHPDVLLLDEPLTSLDVVVADEMKKLLKSIKKEHIIIFSTHIMELAVDLCDEIVILNKGQLSLINKEDLDDDAFQEKIIKILKDEDHA